MNSTFAFVAALGLLASGCGSVNQPSKVYADSTVMQAADTKVVYIIFGGKRHHVPDPQTLEALSVSGQVPMEGPAVIAAVPEGEPIPHLPGKMIQKSTGEVFMLQAGKRHWVPDADTLDMLGGAEQVHGVPDSVLDSIPLGPPLAHMSKSGGQAGRGGQ